MSLRPDGRAISFFGDLHPSFAGNVVKAMGSAKQGYPVVSRDAGARAPPLCRRRICAGRELNDELRAVVHDVVRLTPNIVEVVVRRRWRRGRSSRASSTGFRTSRRSRPVADGTVLAMEGLALTGASVDRETRPALHHRAGDGRVVRSLRAAQAGRARHPDGTDRHADRNARHRKRSCWPAAVWATRCSSPSASSCAHKGRA